MSQLWVKVAVSVIGPPIVIDAGLVVPAYDYVLKCSHLFNVLDARGAISVTERVGVIGRIRALAVGVAKAYALQAA